MFYKVTLASGYEFFYKKQTDIAVLLLSQPDAYQQFLFKWNYNSGYIDHSNNTDRWLDLLVFFGTL